jgi:hypothetical protein
MTGAERSQFSVPNEAVGKMGKALNKASRAERSRWQDGQGAERSHFPARRTKPSRQTKPILRKASTARPALTMMSAEGSPKVQGMGKDDLASPATFFYNMGRSATTRPGVPSCCGSFPILILRFVIHPVP